MSVSSRNLKSYTYLPSGSYVVSACGDLDPEVVIMKVAALLSCTFPFFFFLTILPNPIHGAAIQAPLDLITLDDITQSDRDHLEYLNQKLHHSPVRPKRSGSRSGSGDILYSITAGIGQGIKNKIGQIAKSSVGASGHFSSSSSGHHHDVPETYDHKSFDYWSLKKSILNTLLQAVKAIKGGVIAIKGQLIKGSGYLISAKGKLVAAKGEAITNLGKNIASSAVLVPHPSQKHPPATHEDYHHYPHHPHHPPSTGAILEDYHASHSAPGPEYEIPEHHHSPHSYPTAHHDDTKHCDPETGILILKKIPHSGRGHSDHHHLAEGHDDHPKIIPPFKPLKPASSGPSFGQIVGKFFSASTSLKPGEPAPFGDHSAPGHDTTYHDHLPDHHDHLPDHHDHLPDHHDHYNGHHESHNHHHNDDLESHDHNANSHGHYNGDHHDQSPPDTGSHNHDSGNHNSHHGGTLDANAYLPPLSFHNSESPDHGNHHLKPPPTSYGVPFEAAPDYLSHTDDEYADSSKTHSQVFGTSHTKGKKPKSSQGQVQTYDEIRPLEQAIAQSHTSGATKDSPSSTQQTYDEIRPLSTAVSANDFQIKYLNDALNFNTNKGSGVGVDSSKVSGLSYDLLDNLSQFGAFQNPQSADLSYLANPVELNGDSIFPSPSSGSSLSHFDSLNSHSNNFPGHLDSVQSHTLRHTRLSNNPDSSKSHTSFPGNHQDSVSSHTGSHSNFPESPDSSKSHANFPGSPDSVRSHTHHVRDPSGKIHKVRDTNSVGSSVMSSHKSPFMRHNPHKVVRGSEVQGHDSRPKFGKHRAQGSSAKGHRSRPQQVLQDGAGPTKKKPQRPRVTSYNEHQQVHHVISSKKPHGTYDVVKSIAYELGPNGPKRL